MINNELLGYVKQQLSISVPKEIITSNLKQQGWTDEDVNEAFLAISIQSVAPVPSAPLPPNIAQPVQPQQFQQPTQAEVKASVLENPITASTHKKAKIFLAITILFLLGIGGGAYAYYSGVFVSLPTLASKAIGNIRTINGANFDTTISVDLSEAQDVTKGAQQMFSGTIFPSTISFTTKGAYDFSDTKNKKVDSAFSIDAGSFSTEAELRLVDSTLYGELIKSPTLTFLPILSKYEGKWFSFPVKSQDTQSLSSLINPITKISGLSSNITDKITPEQQEKIYQMTQNAHFIKMTQRLSSEKINGQLSYHFLFDLDRQGINTYLVLLKEYVNSIGKDDSVLSSFDPTSAIVSLNKIEDFKGEIWIGEKDTLPYKITTSFSIKPDVNKDQKVKINIVSIFSNWNNPNPIIAPTESTPFQTFISSVMSDSLGQARQKASDAGIKSYLSNLRAEGELFYDANNNNSYAGFCSSSGLKNTRQSIESSGGTSFICKDSSIKFAVSSKITDGTYFCIDSTGFANIIQKSITSTVCGK